MFLEVWNVFQEQLFVPQRGVIKVHQVLVDLPHVADVGYDRQAKLSRQQADAEKLADAANAGSIHLYPLDRSRLHKILEDNSVRNMLAQSDGNRRNGVSNRFVGRNIIGMGWFFNPIRIHRNQGLAHLESTREGPLLVGIQHDADLGTQCVSQQESPAQVALTIG